MANDDDYDYDYDHVATLIGVYEKINTLGMTRLMPIANAAMKELIAMVEDPREPRSVMPAQGGEEIPLDEDGNPISAEEQTRRQREAAGNTEGEDDPEVARDPGDTREQGDTSDQRNIDNNVERDPPRDPAQGTLPLPGTRRV